MFIAVVIMTVLLLVSFAVVNIAIKGTIFASSGRDSQLAFYAADAGLECALYWDNVPGTSKFDPVIPGGAIVCGGVWMTDGGAIAGTSTVTKIGGSNTAPVNVALGKPATQAGTFDSNTPASKAVNGDTTSTYSSDISHTSPSNPTAWWEVDLGAEYNISSVVVFNRADCCRERLTDYWVDISNTSGGSGSSYHGTSYPNPSTAFNTTGASGRYVRVRLSGSSANDSGGYFLHLGEVQVFGTPTSGGSSVTDTVWVEDSLPAGATSQQDPFNWMGSNPAPSSGSLANQASSTPGNHQQFFTGATTPFSISTGESMLAYIYLDPVNTPTQVMLQWDEGGGSWGHRAYWGTQGDSCIPWGSEGTASRRYIGSLPAAGQWVRLEVPASQVGLENVSINSMAFTLCNGKATWDKIGKTVTTSGGGGGSGTSNTSTFGFTLNNNNYGNAVNACAIVTVTKEGSNTYIKSRGYNNCVSGHPRRIERGVEVTY